LVPNVDDGSLDPSLRFVPKIATIVPGASGVVPGAKLAALTVPFVNTTGGELAATAGDGVSAVAIRIEYR
jgi:hypothetical protein